ncbi:MAG: DUF6625 family protein [Flavobacterium sp.]
MENEKLKDHTINYQSIVIIIDYFGEWPEWFSLFLESCKTNSTINWLFHTDCKHEQFKIDNVSFKTITKENYIQKVNKKLNINLTLSDNYKLCDLKPMYGFIHAEEIVDFDFFGYGDIDVIYGNIRNFYNPQVLQNNVISSHNWCISGHLAIFKNVKWMRNAFKRYKGWKTIIENPKCERFDEDSFIKVFQYPSEINPKYYFLYDIFNPLSKKYRQKLFLVEQFTTPLTHTLWRSGDYFHPQTWYWKNGELSNEIDYDQKYIYLHFMNFFSGRWMSSYYKKYPVWKDLDKFLFLESDKMQNHGMIINRSGFHVYEKLLLRTDD